MNDNDPGLDLMMKKLRPDIKEKTFAEFLENQTKEVMMTCKSVQRPKTTKTRNNAANKK